MAVNADDRVKEEYTLCVGVYYGTNGYRVQQLVIPDKCGRYPNDPKCAEPYSSVPVFNLHVDDTGEKFAADRRHRPSF
jgi:hypothetical protein